MKKNRRRRATDACFNSYALRLQPDRIAELNEKLPRGQMVEIGGAAQPERICRIKQQVLINDQTK